MTREIDLTQGKVALVDDADFEWLSRFNWCAVKTGKTFYAVRRDGRHPVLMHRVILSASDDVDVDHRDLDGLNNTRANLRLASRSQNMANISKYESNRSGFKGVSWHASHGAWRANITVEWRQYHIGYFDTPEAAARAYDAAAREHFGEFARTNFTD